MKSHLLHLSLVWKSSRVTENIACGIETAIYRQVKKFATSDFDHDTMVSNRTYQSQLHHLATAHQPPADWLARPGSPHRVVCISSSLPLSTCPTACLFVYLCSVHLLFSKWSRQGTYSQCKVYITLTMEQYCTRKHSLGLVLIASD